VNLNHEDKWVENSRDLSLYEKKNYARNVFYRKVKIFKKFGARVDRNDGHGPKRMARKALRM